MCIKNSFNHLRPYLATGLPELDVPAMEPLFIDQMAMENDAGAVRIKALFSGISCKGAGNFSIKEVRSDLSVSGERAHSNAFGVLRNSCLIDCLHPFDNRNFA